MNKPHGFTLIELVAVLVIVLLGITIGIPSWQDLLANNRAASAINQLIGAFNLARSEAIKRGLVVSVCQSLDQKSCGGTWQDGQLVFIDRGANGNVVSSNDILHVFPAIEGAVINAHFFGLKKALQFLPTGMLNNQNGTMLYCPKRKNKNAIRALLLNKLGRIRVLSENKGCP